MGARGASFRGGSSSWTELGRSALDAARHCLSKFSLRKRPLPAALIARKIFAAEKGGPDFERRTLATTKPRDIVRTTRKIRMPNPTPSEDEALVDTYRAAFDAARPPATPIDKDKARRAEITAHAAATLAIVRSLLAASPRVTPR
jgi:hypothetical protein